MHVFGAAWPGFDFDFGFLLKNWLTSHIVGRVLRAWEARGPVAGVELIIIYLKIYSGMQTAEVYNHV